MRGSPNISVVIMEASGIVRERLVGLMSRVADAVIVGTAEKGAEGLALCARQQQVDVAIVDMELPDVNTMDLLRRIRKLQPACRIIALTSYPFKELRLRSLESGADFCFDKTRDFENAIDVCEEIACQNTNPSQSGAKKNNPREN